MKIIRKKVDWSASPEIRWEKVLCPICGQPSGPSSRCYEIEPEGEGEDKIMLKTIEINGSMSPILSTQCVFRKSNDYFFYTNFPLSHPLVTKIGSVNGLEKVVIHSPYKGKITVAEQFEEEDVKKDVQETYLDYIKSVAKEALKDE